MEWEGEKRAEEGGGRKEGPEEERKEGSEEVWI